MADDAASPEATRAPSLTYQPAVRYRDPVDGREYMPVPGTLQTPSPTSRFALKDLKLFPAYQPDSSTSMHFPARPDDSRVAADTRALIGKSTEKPEKRGRPRKVKENEPAANSAKTSYDGNSLVMVARVVVDTNPWISPYGQKALSWNEIATKLRAQGFRHDNVSGPKIQNKAEALVQYKKVRYHLISFSYMLIETQDPRGWHD